MALSFAQRVINQLNDDQFGRSDEFRPPNLRDMLFSVGYNQSYGSDDSCWSLLLVEGLFVTRIKLDRNRYRDLDLSRIEQREIKKAFYAAIDREKSRHKIERRIMQS